MFVCSGSDSDWADWISVIGWAMSTVSERHAAVLFAVAMYATEKKLERHEIDNCVQAALSSLGSGVSPSTAVEIGKQSVAAYSAERIIKNMPKQYIPEEEKDTELFSIVSVMSALVVVAAVAGAWGGYRLHELELVKVAPVVAKSDLNKSEQNLRLQRLIVEKYHGA